MALVNCYRYERADNNAAWVRSGGIYKIRPGGVSAPQPLGFHSFRLQRLLMAIGIEFANVHAQFRGHLEVSTLNDCIRSVINAAGISPRNTASSFVLPTDDLGTGRYSIKLELVDTGVNADQALMIGIVTDATQSPICINCGLAKNRPKMDARVKSHSVVPASFWEAIVPSALAAVGVTTDPLTGANEVLRNSMLNAGQQADGSYVKPGADAQAISMCSDCESRQADFSLLQRHERATKWLRVPANHAKEAAIRTYVGTQFLAQPSGIGERDEFMRVTYNVAKRVAGAMERLIFSALAMDARALPVIPPAVAPAPAPRAPVTVTGKRFGSGLDVQNAMRTVVLPDMLKQVANRSISTWVGITSLEAKQWVARESTKARQWVDHASLRIALEVRWSGDPIAEGKTVKTELQQLGIAIGKRRAKSTWHGLPGEPPLSLYLAQNMDAYLQAVVEFAVLFAGLTRRDQSKDDKQGTVSA